MSDRISENIPLLPRSAWKSKVAYLKAIYKVKAALDIIEQETETVNKSL